MDANIASRIYLNYHRWLIYFIPLIALLFWIAPYLHLNQLFSMSYLLFILHFSAYYLLGEAFDFNQWTSNGQMLFLCLLAIGVWGKSNNSLNEYWPAGMVIPLFIFLVLGLLCDYYIFLRNEIDYNVPTSALQTSQALAFLGFLLYIHLRTLPRR